MSVDVEVVHLGELVDRLVRGIELEMGREGERAGREAAENQLRRRIPVTGRVEVVDGGRITIIHLKTELYGEQIRVHGVAKACPEDKPQRDIGKLLAMGRALEHLGRKLQRRAWGQVKQVDHQRRHRETLKPRQASFLP